MTTEADLLDAIAADPWDDGLRLAHLDWLDANGEATRAACVRRYYSWPRHLPWPQEIHLPAIPGVTWQYRRGLPDGAIFNNVAAFRRGASALASLGIRHVTFRSPRSVAAIAAEPGLAGVVSLGLMDVSEDDIGVVLRSPHLSALRRLEVVFYNGPGEALRRLAVEWPRLEQLESLSWWYSAHDPHPSSAYADFFASPRIRGLRDLELAWYPSHDAMRLLWESPNLSALRTLAIHSGGYTMSGNDPATLNDLGDGSATPNLECFLYRYSGATACAAAVAGARRWTRLRCLDLSQRWITDEGVAELAGAPHLSRLECLNLSQNRITDAGAAALAASPNLRSLRTLDLQHNAIGRTGVAALGATTSLPRLRRLSLAGNAVVATFAAEVEARFRTGGPPVTDAPTKVVAVKPPDVTPVGEPEADGLIRAILADPFDDLSRAAYADWLEERGAVGYASILRATADTASHFDELKSRMSHDAPCEFTLSPTGEGLLQVIVEAKSMWRPAFRQRAAAWLRRHHVFGLSVTGRTPKWRDVFASDALSAVRGLRLATRDELAWQSLAASPHVSTLAALATGDDYLRNAFDRFLETADIRSLCLLRRDDRIAYLESSDVLLTRPFAPHLRNLAVSTPTERYVTELADSTALSGLVTLAVALDTERDARRLADARGLPSLRNLDLSFDFPDDGILDAFASSPLVRQLRRLRVRAYLESRDSLARLARAMADGSTLVLDPDSEPIRPPDASGVNVVFV